MHNLKPITALGGTTARIDDFDGLRISECPDWAYASLAFRLRQEEAAAAAAKQFIGADLPDVARCLKKEPFSVFWMGPHQWMIEAPHATHELLESEVKKAVGETASVTEQTDAWTRFDLEGKHCHDVLEIQCNADTRMMEEGYATRTLIGGHIGAFLICRKKDTHFSIIGPRSSAGSLYGSLVTAARSAI